MTDRIYICAINSTRMIHNNFLSDTKIAIIVVEAAKYFFACSQYSEGVGMSNHFNK